MMTWSRGDDDFFESIPCRWETESLEGSPGGKHRSPFLYGLHNQSFMTNFDAESVSTSS